jgi:DNA-directed RNA polymerase II subunit RPB2
MSEETGHSVFIQMKLLQQDLRMCMNIPYVTSEIPVGYMLRAYECSREEVDFMLEEMREMMRQSGCEPRAAQKCRVMLTGILHDYLSMSHKEDVIRYLCQHASYTVTKDRKVGYVDQIIYNEIFPHLGISSTRLQKVLFLGHMMKRITAVLVGMVPLDDRDHVSNKRIETTGVLIGDLFRTLYKRMIRSIEPHLVKRPDIGIILTRVNSVTLGLKHCFSTGNWGIPKSNYIRTGVSQVMSRLTFNGTLSHLRRCLIPIGKEGKKRV